MTDIYDRLSRLLRAAEEANDDFDTLAFGDELFPVGGDCLGTDLMANLDYLRDELRAWKDEVYVPPAPEPIPGQITVDDVLEAA